MKRLLVCTLDLIDAALSRAAYRVFLTARRLDPVDRKGIRWEASE